MIEPTEGFPKQFTAAEVTAKILRSKAWIFKWAVEALPDVVEAAQGGNQLADFMSSWTLKMCESLASGMERCGAPTYGAIHVLAMLGDAEIIEKAEGERLVRMFDTDLALLGRPTASLVDGEWRVAQDITLFMTPFSDDAPTHTQPDPASPPFS